MDELEHLDKINDIWCRTSEKEVTNKQQVFENTIFQLTGKKWKSEDFEPVGIDENIDNEECNCICSKKIKYKCYLKQISTGHIFRVGIVCYQNKTNLKKDFMDKINYLRAKRDGRVCKLCNKICQARSEGACSNCRKVYYKCCDCGDWIKKYPRCKKCYSLMRMVSTSRTHMLLHTN